MTQIDFSCKHHILLEDEEGLMQPMDEPYFRSNQIAPGTWQILSDGDYSYLLEGDREALLIDSGYGAGNIRVYCEQVCSKPVRRIANTHHHFDHTANNSYFELAYMAPESVALATIPLPSFEGISFPREYPVQIVDDGDRIPLEGRKLEVIKSPDHTIGGIAFLDRRERILFSGDELFMHRAKDLNGTVFHWKQCMEHLMQFRPEFDVMYGGGQLPASLCEANLQNVCHILEGHEGVPCDPPRQPGYQKNLPDGRVIWKRRAPHPGDQPKHWGVDQEYKRLMVFGGCGIQYDIRRIGGA